MKRKDGYAQSTYNMLFNLVFVDIISVCQKFRQRSLSAQSLGKCRRLKPNQ